MLTRRIRTSLGAGLLLCALAMFAAATRAAEAPPLLTEDALVAQVLDRVAERLAVMPQVAAVKWRSHGPIADPPREQALLDATAARAGHMGLAPLPVREFFALQIRYARDTQLRLHGRWLKTGCEICASPPDLGALRARIDEINDGLLRALYLGAPLFGSDDFVERFLPAANARLSGALPSPDDRRALLVAAHAMRLAAAPGLERIRSSGLLRIGTTGDYDPFSIESQGRVSGADVELGLALAQALGVEPVFVKTSWPTLQHDLAADRYDLAISGIAVNPERATTGLFSVPYQSGGKTILARCDSRERLDSLRKLDRPTVTVIVNPGGTNERYVRANLHRARVIVFPDNRGIFDELVAGRADAMITDDVEAELQSRRHPELCRATAGTLTHADKAVYMARDPALKDAVDEWLASAVASGLPARLLAKQLGR